MAEKQKELDTARTIGIGGSAFDGTKPYNYGIQTNGVTYQDDRTTKISYWLSEIKTYTGSETIRQPNSNEVCVVRPIQQEVWFNVVGESLQRTLELNLNNTNNTSYKVYYFTSNINTQNYGYFVTHNNGAVLYFAGTFGLKLTAITINNSSCYTGLGNMGYVYNHIGTYPVRITINNKKVTSIRTKSYENKDCGIVGGHGKGICMSNFRGGYNTGEHYKNLESYGHGYNKWWNNYLILIADIPSGSF